MLLLMSAYRYDGSLTMGAQGDYEGAGHCIPGYGEKEYPQVMPRKKNGIIYVCSIMTG